MSRLFLLFVFLPSIAFADIYKCKNGNGSYLSSEPYEAGALVVESQKPVQNERRKIGIRRGINGGYNIKGDISGHPVDMIFDTGAGMTTISGRVAYALGLGSCQQAGISHTANGDAAFCRASLAKVSFAGFQFENVPVNVMQNLSGDMLIGNNFLHAFKIEVDDDVMYLSR